jgi:predicted dienelactone hydrolase
MNSVAIDLHDAKRQRDVPIRAWLPAGSGTHPVVFFSHGLGESRDSYGYLGAHLARNGYMAIHVTHHGSDKELLEKEGIVAVHRAVRDPQTWVNRPLDVSFVIDLLEAEDPRVAQLIPRADLSRIAIAGHSAGAYTALVMGGAVVKGEARFTDPRVKALVAMSLPKLRPIFLAGAYDEIRIPQLHITGTKDRSLFYWTFPRDRRDAFERGRSTPQYLVTINGAKHETFSNPSRDDRPCEQKMQALIADATVLFLDAYLRGDEDAGKRLTNGLDGAKVERK